MALQETYKQFLAAPNPSLLANDATFHYVTTTTTFRGAPDIIKHLNTLLKQVKKKKEDFLTVIESHHAIAIEVDTSLEFVTSGASYLPGLDDNFLSDRTVYLPITHIVTFDADKILQIRLSWDQGSLLKQLDIIGKSGRNWPIRDAREQIKLIESATKTTAGRAATSPAFESRGTGNTASTAPLALFAPREEAEQETMSSVISPKGGARPRQRGFAEILGDEPVEDAGSPSAGRGRSQSPSKAIAPKIGAGKNFQPNRLFETEDGRQQDYEEPDDARPVERFYQPNPKRYDHFDFGDREEPETAPQQGQREARRAKHASQWGFEDFETPAKVRPSKVLQKGHQDVRHWGNEDDHVEETPIRKPAAAKPRRDAETHFEFVDDGERQGNPPVTRPRGVAQNAGLGLYKNNVYREEGESEQTPGNDGQTLGNITNLGGRNKTFKPQFAMTDDPPTPEEKQRVGQDRMQAVKMMDANWAPYDESPRKENVPSRSKQVNTQRTGEDRGIAIGGDGMGGPKGTQRNWLFGEGDGEPAQSVPTRKQGAAKSGGFTWDF